MTVPPPSYHPVAKFFHWLMAGLIALQFAVAWTMPEIHRGTQPDRLISLHLSIGALLLLVALLRLAWRLGHPVPPLTDGIPPWQVKAASAVHALLYLLLLVIPVLGWANASARGWSVTLLGVLPLPAILPAHVPWGGLVGDIHSTLSYGLLGIVALHAGAALFHHFRLRDATLSRMLPGRRGAQ